MNNSSPTIAKPSLPFALMLAFVLPLILASVFTPMGLARHEFDFFLLCLMASIMINIPLLLLEFGLAKRAKTVPLQGMMQLTREADASTHWRWSSWLGVIILPLMAGLILSSFSQQLMTVQNLTFSSAIVVLILAIITLALSILPRAILLLVTTLASLVTVAVSLPQLNLQTWHWTGFSLKEWSQALTILIASTGIGLGIFWQNLLHTVQPKDNLFPLTIPVWLAQLMGIIAFAFLTKLTALSSASLAIAGISLAALLLHFAREQLLARQVALPIQAAILIIPLLLWALPILHIGLWLVVILVFINVLMYSVFAGWTMKISHLRKSLQLPNEFVYNLWRIAVRIILPLAIMIALLGYFVG